MTSLYLLFFMVQSKLCSGVDLNFADMSLTKQILGTVMVNTKLVSVSVEKQMDIQFVLKQDVK